jgi:hypothetical protein
MEVALQLVAVEAVPLNRTTLVPCVGPKFVPAIVTLAPTGADVGVTELIVGVGSTVKVIPLLTTPATTTVTGPLVAPAGTTAVMVDALQLATDATVPLKRTVLEPCVLPKPVPVIVIVLPTPPDVGFTELTIGCVSTVKGEPLLATPATVTVTRPVVALEGTVAVIDVVLQLVTVAVTPLNLTVLVLCVAPKLLPAIVTVPATGAWSGLSELIAGGGMTVNATPLLARLLTVTVTFPLVAPAGTTAVIDVAVQLVMLVAVTPLNLTVLLGFCVPKLLPLTVTVPPTGPAFGVSDEIDGGVTTVYVTPLLLTPFTLTTTEPLVAPDGTWAVIDDAVQFVTLAVTPLNFTVLVPCDAPKLLPAIVTLLFTCPLLGVRELIEGAPVTVKVPALCVMVPTFTVSEPVVAPEGTVTVRLVTEALETVAVVPLNLTVLLPGVALKLRP